MPTELASPGRSWRRPVLAALVCVTAVLATACGGSSDPAADTVQSTTTTPASAAAGRVEGDVAVIREFSDPATQIVDSGDLTEYLLPGLTGEGAECVEQTLVADEVLAMPLDEGSTHVADVIATCVDPSDWGTVVLMYAVGFDVDGAEQFNDLEPCVQAHGSEADPLGSSDQIRALLKQIYAARLDLAAPPTSPDIALRILKDTTNCMDPGSADPSPTSTSPPSNARSIPWNMLTAGDCLPKVPSSGAQTVGVANCDLPHEAEVVGATFSSDNAESACRAMFKSYTGKNVDQTDLQLGFLKSADAASSMRLICLAQSPGGKTSTGSIRS